MLSRSALESNDDPGRSRLDDDDGFDSASRARDKVRAAALKVYKEELFTPASIDLHLHGVSRAALRVLCQQTVLESSTSIKRRYSYSAVSSVQSIDARQNARSALRTLQKERMIATRLGFPDKAKELDKEIEMMREKAKKERDTEEGSFFFWFGIFLYCEDFNLNTIRSFYLISYRHSFHSPRLTSPFLTTHLSIYLILSFPH